MPKLNHIILPTPAEDAKINAQIAADPENPEWTDQDFARARPAKEALTEIFGKHVAKEMLRPRGRPCVANPKERINIRLSHDVLAFFKGTGRGWQSKIDAALKDYLTEHLVK